MQLAQVPPFRLGELEVRPAERTIVFAGGREILEPRVMEVLVTLAKADGRVVGRDELVDACWGGRAVTDDAVNRAVSRVRRVSELHDGPTFTLETIAKVGYRLVLAEAAQAAEAASLSVEPVSAPQAERHALLLGLALAAIAAVMVAFAAFILEPRHTPPARPDLGPLTLAVLPFDGVSKSDNTEFLAKSLPLEIRSRLSRMRGLRVIAETSSFAVAAELYGRAIAGRSFCISETMPFGAYEFTPETRADPRYQEIWCADPAVRDLRRSPQTARASLKRALLHVSFCLQKKSWADRRECPDVPCCLSSQRVDDASLRGRRLRGAVLHL